MATLTPMPLLAALAYYRARASYCPLPSREKEPAGPGEELQAVEGVEEKKEVKVVAEKEVLA